MLELTRILELARTLTWWLSHKEARRWLDKRRQPLRRTTLRVDELEDRVVPTLLGQQLFPADYPWNQNIASAPVASNSAAIISHIGGSIGIHPDWGNDSASNGNSPLYGIPYNVVHGNSTAKINVIIDNYPGESDIVPVPIPANAVIEGDFQNGPNPNGGGYNANQRGDSHLLIWDEDTDTAYELYGVTRPTDTTLFPNTSGVELAHTDGLWHAAQESVWHMSADSFRTLGATSADAAGLSILAGLARPDEGLPVSQGGQGAIDHALRLTLPSGDVDPQYIYPASHIVSTSSGSTKLPFGARLRLLNTPAVNAAISTLGPEAQIIAHAMQQYGLVLADIGSSMYVTGTSASEDANNNISLTWNMDDVLGLHALTASDFQVVNLTPVVTGLSATSGAAGSTITITGQNFSGSAGHLSVFFGSTPSSSVTYVSDTQITAVVPGGTGNVNVTVQSGVNETDDLSGPNANVTGPIFGYGTSAITSADQFSFGSQTISGTNTTDSFASATVVSGTTDVLTIVVKDATGNAVSGLSSSAFAFSFAGGTSAGTFAPVTATATPGTYTTTLTGTTAGTVSTLTTTVSGVTLSSHPTVTVSAGAGSGATSTVSFATATVASGGTDMVTIAVKDAAGNAVSGLASSAFSLSLSGGVSAGTFGTVTETATLGIYTATFTAVTAGTASTLTTTVSGVTLTIKPTVQVIAGGINGTNSTVSFATSSVGSGNSDTLTVIVKDAAGNPVTGLANSAFAFGLAGGTSAGTFGTVTATATAGKYTAIFTGTTAGTSSTLTATVGGVTLATQPTITVTAGSVSGAASTVSFGSPSVSSGNTDQLTIVVKDAAGNAVSGLASSAFVFSLAGGTSAGTFGVVTATATAGTYITMFTGTTAGTLSTLTTKVSGVSLNSHPTITVNFGAVSGTTSTVSFATATVTSSNADLVTIAVKDAAGNAVSGLASSAFNLSLAGGTSAGTFGIVTETATAGIYKATFTAGTAGTGSTLTTIVSGITLNATPTVQVIAGGISGANSTVGFATSTVASGNTDTLTLAILDAAGNPVTGLASSAFAFSLAGGTSSGAFGTVTATATAGTYTATLTGTTAGTSSTLIVTVGGMTLTTQPTLTVTTGAVGGATSTLSFATSTVTSGNTDLLTVAVKDAAGNAVSGLASSAFSFSLAGGTSAGTFGIVTETATAGIYTATFTAVTAGTVSTLTTKISGATLNATPTVLVIAGGISGTNSTVSFASSSVGSGATDVLTIVVKDTTGNPVTGLASSAFNLSLAGGTSAGAFGSVTASATAGSYTATFTGGAAGTTSTLTVVVGGVTLANQATITVTSSAVSATRSTVCFAASTVATGKTDKVTIQVKDQAGHAVTGLQSSAFLFSLSGGTSTGTFGAVTETATNGTYTVLFTGVNLGTRTSLLVTVNGVILAARPTIEVIHGSVSGVQSAVMFATPTVASRQTTTVTIVVKDAAGNPISGLTSNAFYFSLSGGSSDGIFGPVIETSTPGTYTVLFMGTRAGTASTLTTVVNGETLRAKPKITVVGGRGDRW